MDLRTLLHPVVDYQKVTVVIGGESITTSTSLALFSYLTEEALNKQVEMIEADANVLKVWVKND